MKYYQYLDLDFLPVVEKFKIYISNNNDKIQGFWTYLDTPEMLAFCPEIQKMFDPMNITVEHISIITADIGHTNNRNSIHRDDTNSNVRINIPILNCAESITNFYTTSEDPVKMYLPNGIPYFYYDYNKCTLVDSFSLYKPAALRVTELHQVVANKNHLPRISITVEFEENIDGLLDF